MTDKKKSSKRKYTVSEAARKQRQGAAWKTGEHAGLTANRLGHPCKPSLCPNGEPCEIKLKVAAGGGALGTCVVDLAAKDEHIERYREALEKGDPKPLQEIQAVLLGSQSSLATSELERLCEEGLVSEVSVEAPDGTIVTRLVPSPRAELLFKLLRQVGATAEQQQITPKARAEGKVAAAAVNHFEYMAELWERTEQARGEG